MAHHIESFLTWADDAKPKLAEQVRKLNDGANKALEGILVRFDHEKTGRLDPKDAWLASRALDLLHRPSGAPIKAMAKVLDYLDVDGSHTLTLDEMTLAVEILEMFANADSENDTLSTKELEMLEAVLEHLDTNGNGKLDADERVHLRDALWQPKEFLDEQRASNPHLRKVLGLD